MASIRELTRHVRDYMSDASGGKADRIALELVNDALRMLFRSHRWQRFRRRSAKIQLDNAVAGAAAALTQGSAEVVLTGEYVLDKYLTKGKAAESWDLWLEGDNYTLYRAVELRSPTAFVLDRPWIAATDAAAAYAWRRSRYPLPDGLMGILNAQLSVSRSIAYVDPVMFDQERFDRPTETGPPQFFTVREDALEVWPPLDTTTTREHLLLTYDSAPVAVKATDDVDKRVDWPTEDDDLLRAAINVLIATNHASQTHLNLATSERLYTRLLGQAKARDSSKAADPRQFGLSFTPDIGAVERYLFRRAPTGADA